MELLFNCRRVPGVTRYLLRWRNHTFADESAPEEATAARRWQSMMPPPPVVVQVAGTHRSRRLAATPPSLRRPPTPAAPPLVVAPAGFRLPTPAEVATGPALVVRTVLYYWLGDGWVCGTVARRSRAQGFSHVVRYDPRSVLGAAMVDSLLDAASHGPASRWVLLCPTR